MFSMSPKKLLKKIRAFTITLSVLGIVLSGYSIYVHQRKEANKDYKAFCDISEEISCSKVFTSRWGRGFGILGSLLGEDSPAVLANGFYGIAFYLIVIALGELQSTTAANIQKYSVLLTNLMSVYLGYILLFVLKDKCVVCFSIYAINFLIAVLCFLRVHYLVGGKSKKGAKSTSNQNAKQTTGKKNQQNANKSNNQTANKNIQNAKSNQEESADDNQISKKKKKGKKQNAEPVINHQNVSSKKKPEQLKNAQNNIKNRQNQNPSKKNQQNAVHQQNASNKQSSNKNASQNKHSKKKNN